MKTCLKFAAALAMASTLGAATVHATPIEDFEGFADSTALNAALLDIKASTTVALNATDGVGGSQALEMTGNNGTAPFFSQARLDVDNFTLTGIDAVTIDVKFVGGSTENMQVGFVNEFGVVITNQDFGPTSGFSTTDYTTISVDTSGTGDTVDALLLSYNSPGDFGTTTVLFDNLSAVPEPSSLVLVAGIMALTLNNKRRRS